jgi:hypothetical protein
VDIFPNVDTAAEMGPQQPARRTRRQFTDEFTAEVVGAIEAPPITRGVAIAFSGRLYADAAGTEGTTVKTIDELTAAVERLPQLHSIRQNSVSMLRAGNPASVASASVRP